MFTNEQTSRFLSDNDSIFSLQNFATIDTNRCDKYFPVIPLFVKCSPSDGYITDPIEWTSESDVGVDVQSLRTSIFDRG